MKYAKDIWAQNALETTAKPTSCRTAKLSAFRAPSPKLLFGERLKEVSDLEAFIAAHGLMRPLKVAQLGHKLFVIDGSKRLCALRRMRFKNTLPRSLVNIPFIMNTCGTSKIPVPHLLSPQDQYRDMTALIESGINQDMAAQTLCLNAAEFRDLTHIDHLSPRLKTAFLDRTLTLQQANAFAALPCYEDQDSLLLSIGPYASIDDILIAIHRIRSTPKAAAKPTVMIDCRRIIDCKQSDSVIHMPNPPLTGLAGHLQPQQRQAAA